MLPGTSTWETATFRGHVDGVFAGNAAGLDAELLLVVVALLLLELLDVFAAPQAARTGIATAPATAPNA
jgi:hypothetical protein